MELELKYDEVQYKKRILMKQFTKEETFEVNIPDTQPDAVRTVCAAALPYMKSKDAESGRMTVTGSCDISVAYASDTAPELSVVTVTRDYTASVESSELNAGDLLTADITVAVCEARIINSRKLLIKLELKFSVEAYAETALKIPVDIERKDGIETLSKTYRARLPYSVNEKVFTITDSHELENLGRIIGSTLSFFTEEIKRVGAKAVVRGFAKTRLIYITNSGSIAAKTFESPFSQVVDLEFDEDYADHTALVTPTGAYISNENGAGSGEEVSLELHGVIQCVSYKEIETDVLYDAYSLSGDIRLEKDKLCLESFAGNEKSTADLSVEFKTPIEIRSIDAVIAYTGLTDVTKSEDGATLSVNASVTTVYSSQTEDNYGTVRGAEGGDRLSQSLYDYEPFTSYADAEHAEYNRTEDGIAVRLSVKSMLTKYENVEIPVICSAEITENEAERDLSAMIVYRIRPEDSLWNIAKKYRSTRELILNANDSVDESELKTGKLILILKK